MHKISWLLVFAVLFLTAALPKSVDATSVIASVDVGSYPRGIAVNPNTDRIYVAGEYSMHVSVIDGATNSIVATIPLHGRGWDVAVNPSTNRIYVVTESPVRIEVIDGETNSVIALIPRLSSDISGAISVNPTTNRIYWTEPAWNRMSVIDGVTHAVIATLNIGYGLYDVAVNPITNRIYVLRMYDDSISVLNGETHAVVATVPVGDFPYGVAVDSIANRIFVSNGYSSNVSVIDGASNAVIATIPVPVQGRVAVNPYINHIYIGHYSDINVVDVTTNSIIATIPVGRYQTGFAVNPSTNHLYASDYWSGRVLVISDGDNAGHILTPTSYDFGNVQWGQTSTAMFTISNTGNGELTLSAISLSNASGVFSITSALSLPQTLPAGQSTTVEVTFSPTAIQMYTGALQISSSDAEKPSISISLSGTGVLADTPSEQVEAVVAYIQDAIDAHDLEGVGSGNSADKKVQALINMIEAAGDLLEAGQTVEGCQQLADIYLKVDGATPPPDFVTGEAREGLANAIQGLRAHYGCQ